MHQSFSASDPSNVPPQGDVPGPPSVGRRHVLRATGVIGAVLALGAGDRRRPTPLVPPASAAEGEHDTARPAAAPAPATPVVPAPEIVPFSEWASDACPAPTGDDPAPVERLVVHHTYEPAADTPDEVLWALDVMCDAHTARGFDTIGYHYFVDPWGRIWQGRGGLPGPNGEPPEQQPQGAHVAGSNRGAVGVAFVGDHSSGPPTDAALDAATHLLAWLLQATDLDPHEQVTVDSTGVGTAKFTGPFQTRAIAGHSASNVTECPGHYLEALIDRIRDEVQTRLRGEDPTVAIGRPGRERG